MKSDEDRPLSELGDEKRDEETQREESEVLDTLDATVTKVVEIPPNEKTRSIWLQNKMIVLYVIVTVLFSAVLYFFVFASKDESADKPTITSYEECVAAGYPIMESYPEQCAVPDGDSFTRTLTAAEQQALLDGMNEESVNVEEEGNDLTAELPEGWTTHVNGTQGITFNYPEEWGAIEEAVFDSNGNADYFGFSSFDYMALGGFETGYEPGARGGTLIDYGGFINDPVDGLTFRSYVDGTSQGEADNYVLNTPENCIYNIGLIFFGDVVYHATCNLNKEENLVYNFAVLDISQVEESDFLAIVESVVIE